MNSVNVEELKYPIGKFNYDRVIEDSEIPSLLKEIDSLPHQLKLIINQLSHTELDTPYRPGGWTVKQVVHHLADSHINAYIRFQLALTEDEPVIKPYKENLWAELPFKKNLSVADSLQLLGIIQSNLVSFIRVLSSTELDRYYIHPEYDRKYSLRKAVALYAWHGNHHLTHITRLKERNFDR